MKFSQIWQLRSENREFNGFYEVDIWLVLDGTTFIRHFVTKTHSFRDKIASGQRSKISSQTSTVANYMHLKGGKNSNIFVIICIYVN